MRASDRAVILGVAVVGLALGFYLLVLGPKRDEASRLGAQVSDLHASISNAEQQASFGEQARRDFPRYYGRMVVLGKAVPAQSDTASLLVQFNSISQSSKVKFQGISLSQGSSGAGTGTSSSSTAATTASTTASSTPTGTSTSTSPTSTTPSGTSGSTGSTTASATSTGPTGTATASLVPATEASAASQPIGAVVGTAAFPTLPYDLTLRGGYFQVASFLGGIDGLVKPVDDASRLSPDGRLLTVNGFALQVGAAGPPPVLAATFLVTSYATGDQGLTLGASPSGPAPTSPTEPQAQPASAVVAK